MTPSPLPSLLMVAAHPDDEVLLAGGVLAQYAAAGAATAVVTATWAAESRRAVELAEALTILGAGKPRMLGYADARNPRSAPGRVRLCDAPLDEVVASLVGHVRELRPTIVITHDQYGQLTGHADHIHTHRATLLAVHAAALPHLYPEAGEPWRPDALYVATHPASGVSELGPLLERVGKTVHSAPDEQVTARIDVSDVVATKWSAICAHRSQVEGRRALPALLSGLTDEVRHRILATEWYTRLDTGPVPGPVQDSLTSGRRDVSGLWDTIGRLGDMFTRRDTARGLSPELQWTVQVLKLTEEVGESAQAIIGAWGANPRKEQGTWSDVQEEVADTAITSLVSLYRMLGDQAPGFLTHVLAQKSARFLPPTGTGSTP
ncbi:PIG-L family deacetylase [Streptomyces sp. NPDC002602]|uniref:PIG-L family deacetylase n=1 Tax=Streptomyces sp. NPDC002602 TaxID=3364654 RepID=UPI0036831D7F